MDTATADEFLNAEFWRALVPTLTVAGCARLHSAAAPTPSSSPLFAESVRERGFSRATARALWSADVGVARDACAALADGVTRLIAAGFPASTILLYDEPWALAEAVHASVSHEAGFEAHESIGDWFVFYVDADAGGKGWAPHRDRPMTGGTPASGDGDEDAPRVAAARAAAIASSFASDGTPAYVTCWLPLTSAPPESSCLYFVPKGSDVGYMEGEAAGASPLCAVINAGDVPGAGAQAIIALPVPCGSLLCFSHRALHWGGSPVRGGLKAGAAPPPPRIALSFALARAEFEPAYLAERSTRAPATHAARAGLVAAQALHYSTQAPLSARATALCAQVAIAAADAGLFADAFESKTRMAAHWAMAGTNFAANKQLAAAGRGAPSAEAVALLFCARAAADEGLPAGDYF
jgi:hypothetical protein